MTLINASRKLAKTCEGLRFGAPATHVYHPLIYARKSYETYLRRFARPPKKAIFVGINPGPWGMAQTGIPFGDVVSARDWMNINAAIKPPPYCHPKYPVLGFDCPRREASGRRLWEFFRARHGTAEAFFADYLTLNYCPLLFLGAANGRVSNLTPDKLSGAEREPLYAACDEFMRAVAAELNPPLWVGIGAFAEQQLRRLFADGGAKIGKILHPSPASPLANRAFAETATAQLRGLGLQ